VALAALVPEPVTAQLTLLAPVVLTARVTVKVKALLPLFPSVWLALVAAIAKVGFVLDPANFHPMSLNNPKVTGPGLRILSPEPIE